MKPRTGSRRLAAFCLLPLVAPAAWSPAAADGPQLQGAVGIEVASPADGCGWRAAPGDEPLPVLVAIDPESLSVPGVLSPLLDCAAAGRLEPVVRLEPSAGWQDSPDLAAALAPWLADLAALAHQSAGRVTWYQLPARPDLKTTPEAYSFLVEKTATALRSADPGARLAHGPLADESAGWFGRLDLTRLSSYAGVYAVQEPAEAASWIDRVRRNDPAGSVWLHVGLESADPARLVEILHSSRLSGARTTFLRLDRTSPLAPALTTLLGRLVSRFVALPAEGAGGSFLFADPLGPRRLLIQTGRGVAEIDPGPGSVGQVTAVDLATGALLPAELAGEGSTRRVRLSSSFTGPVLLDFTAPKGPVVETESLEVSAPRGPSVEEILARHRAHEAAQARRVRHYQARATISYNYRAETLNESIHVSSVNRFFWADGVGEYEETDLYINGARWRGPAPSLPFIAAEKVKEVPLEISLGQAYRYELDGREEVAGREAWIVRFEPAPAAEGALYSGRVWIDAQSYARLRLRLVQHGLKPPITGNEDLLEYEAVAPGHGGADPPGGDVWLPARAYRQMTFTVLGRSVAVEREVLYEQIEVNGAGLEQARQQAYASGHPVLRDDETGYGYLIRQGETMVRRPAESLQNVAFFGGLGFDSGLSPGTPFAGFNYFDFDWRGSGTQIDLAFAGPLLNLAWTDPALAATRWELSMEGRFTALPERFRSVTSEGKRPEEDLEVLEQRLAVTLARPLTSFQKAEAQVEATYDNYGPHDGTDPAFRPPATRPALVASARWRYQRAGYSTDLWFSSGRRLGWESWGLVDPNAQAGSAPLRGGRADQDRFQRWGLGLVKSLYPGRLQVVSFSGSLFAGRRMDRLSRFRVGDFRNARARGYNSLDLTFERGAAGRMNWRFTLPRGGASLELGVEAIAMENEEDFGRREALAGGGAALSFSGPWGTLMSLRGSFPLGSSLDVRSGGASFRFVVIKTLDRWPSRRAAQPAP